MDAEARNLILLVLANARLLFGRNQSCDVVTSQGPCQTPAHCRLSIARAYLIGYSDSPSNMIEHEWLWESGVERRRRNLRGVWRVDGV
jgi:hypothetical protein